MNRPRNAIHNKLRAADRRALEEMRERFGSNAPIKHHRDRVNGKTYLNVTIYFASRRLCDDLFNLGLGPNKDFQDYNLPRVTGATAAAVMRGLFDGDGTVVMMRRLNPPGARIAINNRAHTLEWVKDTVARETGVTGHIYQQRPRHFVYSVMAHEDVERLAGWMYSIPGAYLDRKHDKLFTLLRQHESGLAARHAIFDARERRIAELYGRGVEMPEIAAQTGLTLGTVARHRKRIGIHHRKPYKTPTFADLCEVRRRRNQRETNREVAAAMAFSESTIQKLATDSRALVKLEREWQVVQVVRQWRSSGQFIKVIAKRLGRSPAWVVALLRRYDGIEIGPHPATRPSGAQDGTEPADTHLRAKGHGSPAVQRRASTLRRPVDA
ncbi:MAG: hypothetical protein KGK07_11005 [Chloroflexota bacterium]|nr:hypothetical protein [Chloroflexota bacterium]